MRPVCELSSFHNWCDAKYEVCPLEVGCPIPRATGTVEENLAKAVSLLEKICQEEGISLDDLPPPPPPGIDAVLLRKTATEYAVALHEIGLTAVSVLLAGKCGRIACYLDDEDGEDVWQADAVPNLLLIEKLLADLDVEIPQRKARAPEALVERIETSGRRLRDLLTPLLATIPVTARQVVAALVAAGRAPSPFVRVDTTGVLGDRSPS